MEAEGSEKINEGIFNLCACGGGGIFVSIYFNEKITFASKTVKLPYLPK